MRPLICTVPQPEHNKNTVTNIVKVPCLLKTREEEEGTTHALSPNRYNWFIETKKLVGLIQALGRAANQRKWRLLTVPSSSSHVFSWGE